MASYRLYCVDSAGRISLADWMEAENDEEALALACALKNGARHREVWLGNKIVASLSDQRLTAA